MTDDERADDIMSTIATCDGTACAQVDREWLRGYIRSLRSRADSSDLLREVVAAVTESSQLIERTVPILDEVASTGAEQLKLDQEQQARSVRSGDRAWKIAQQIGGSRAVALLAGAGALWAAARLGVLEYLTHLGVMP